MSLTDKLWGIEGIMTNKLEEDVAKENYIQGTAQFYRSLYCVCMGPWLPVKDEYISQKEEKSEPKTSKKKDENNTTSSNNNNNNNSNSNGNYDIDGWPPLPTFSDNNNTFSNAVAGRTSPTFPPLSKAPSHERRSESAFPRRQTTMPSPPNAHITAIPSTPQTTTPSPLLPPMRNSIILEKNSNSSNNTNTTTQQSTQPQYSIVNTTPSTISTESNSVNNVSSLPALRQRHSEYNLQEPTEFEPQMGLRGYEKRRHRHAVSRGGSLPITQISFSPDDVTYISSGKGPPFFSIPKPR